MEPTETQLYHAKHWYPKGTLVEPFLPQVVNDVMLAFPAGISHLLPPAEKIPEEFCDLNRTTKWNKLFGDMFYKGTKGLKLYPKEGIDPETAFRHIRTIMGSFEPKHEYKEAACAFLLSEWFEDADWTIGG